MLPWITDRLPTQAEYGYIRWRSTPTGKEGGGSALVSNPAQVVAKLNRDFPQIEHWWIPANLPDREEEL